jgi:hypothetical protein
MTNLLFQRLNSTLDTDDSALATPAANASALRNVGPVVVPSMPVVG